MSKDRTIHGETFAFLKERASDLFFILSKDATIIDANRFAQDYIGRHVIGETFGNLVVDFNGAFDFEELKHDPSGERLIHISNFSGLPQSFYFSFKPVADFILAFGRLDVEELETMRKEMTVLNQELSNLTRVLHKKTAQLQDALDHVKTLQGIIPICMHCHNIRNDRQIWERLEAYLAEHTDAELSHSICPECAKKHYPDVDIYDE